MWSPGYLTQFRAARVRVSGSVAAAGPLAAAGSAVGAGPVTTGGPAVATFGTVAAAIVTVVRFIAVGYIVLQVAIWHSFYAAAPWRLVGPAVAAVCAAAVVAGLRHGVPARRLALADASVHVTLALSAAAFVPPLMLGDTASWLYIALLDQLLLPALFTSARLAISLAAVSAAAFWGGDMLGGHPRGNSPLAAAGFLLALAGVVCWGRRALQRRATAADAALARADRETREQYVVRSRSAERREHERLLHDTVLNTLTALSREGTSRAADVIGRCRHDIALMEQVVSEVADWPADGVLARIEQVAAEMRVRGLDVRVTAGPVRAEAVPRGVPRPRGVPPPRGVPAPGAGPVLAGPALAVPAPAAAAVAHAVREALVNVLLHAGTSLAWVEVSLAGDVLVRVRDAGAGFDPSWRDRSRLGVRRSIIERLADAGGEASIRSAPGAGTVVSLRWPRRHEAPPAGPGLGD
jgi:signal transduction histidine kinase